MKTESRYKDKLIAESCLHLHKILGNVVFQSIGCRLFVESHTFGDYFALNILSIINFNPIQTFHQPLRTRGCNNINKKESDIEYDKVYTDKKLNPISKEYVIKIALYILRSSEGLLKTIPQDLKDEAFQIIYIYLEQQKES